MDLIRKVFELQDQLSEEVRTMHKYGIEYAKAKREFLISMAEAELKLRDEGVPATLVKDIAKGQTANKRFSMDAAEVVYNTAQESINATKLAIKMMNDQIKREWGNDG